MKVLNTKTAEEIKQRRRPRKTRQDTSQEDLLTTSVTGSYEDATAVVSDRRPMLQWEQEKLSPTLRYTAQ